MANNYLGTNVGVGLNLQQHGSTGGKRYVFVDLNDAPKSRPPFGGIIQNPFPAGAKAYQGDIVEYSTDGKVKLLKVYKLAKALAAADTAVLFVRDGFSHKPFAGDIVMVAPSTLSGTGTGVTLGAVTATTATVGTATVDVWSCAITAGDFSASEVDVDTLFVQASAAGSSKAPYITNPNGFLEEDIYFNYVPASGNSDFDGARYNVTPILHATVWSNRCTPIPTNIGTRNKSYVTGWFEL